MQRYDFIVLRDEATIAAERSVALPDLKAAWPRITALAQTFDQPGGRIRVTNEAGDVVILVGVTAALHPASIDAPA
jgi:hypothetical protein